MRCPDCKGRGHHRPAVLEGFGGPYGCSTCDSKGWLTPEEKHHWETVGKDLKEALTQLSKAMAKSVKSFNDVDDEKQPGGKRKKPRKKRSVPRLKVGDKVAHPSFGKGVILKIEGRGRKKEVSVHFGKHGIKVLAGAFAPLKRAK